MFRTAVSLSAGSRPAAFRPVAVAAFSPLAQFSSLPTCARPAFARLRPSVRPRVAAPVKNTSVGRNTTVWFAFSSAPAAPGTPIQDKIAKDVSSSKVVLYMKGTPQQPQCGFSRTVVQILEAEGSFAIACPSNVPSGVRDFKSFNVLDSQEIREGIKKFRYLC
jgi:glutaredoxin-related protein